ncbi:sigma-70 family RNA polymerase sigma factor [Amycolatopsis sp. OK19-0408]|uniref:Sigma-70 family RNA polymerase sigma factor n=1 Tax=Amycolatopsis iheyensis TaxID=2945988 RepID=A0A9X2NI75_9PSEU|nr:sigma-70 family RNA polymerase sigma factor [Amycolatopsis iheyensis]MCR6488247.1 sigma-70 family RNA polymerase sigma factor [Amycolatopsis iheyensis]
MGSLGPPSAPLVESFEEFYRLTAPRTFRAVLRIAAGDSYIAQDATQEAYCQMLRLWSHRQHVSSEDNRKYVLGIASKKVMDVYRRQRKLADLDDELEAWAQEDIHLAAVLDELTVLRVVRELIAQQPPRRRAVAVLFFIEEFNYDEVAYALTMSKSTVRTHVERLRAVLKPGLDQLNQTDQGGERQ